MKRTTLTAGLGVLLAATLLAPTPAQAAPAPNAGDKSLAVIQHNTDSRGYGPAVQWANALGGVDAITYQELCKKEIAPLKAAGFDVHWRLQVDPKKEGKCTKGNAIVTPRAHSNPQTFELLRRRSTDKWRDLRIFKLLCVDMPNSGVGKATVCTTHFPLDYNGKNTAPSGLQNRLIVADKIKSIVNRKIANGRRVILTGDFNSFPKTSPLSRFYSYAGGNGRFVEGDPKCKRKCRDMAPTTSNGKKIDYFLASSPKLGRIDKQIGSAYDPVGHYPVLGTATY